MSRPSWVIILFLGTGLLACDEPTRPAPAAATGEGSVLLSRLAALGPAFADEADRLLPVLGDRYTEQPLRLALRTIRQWAAAEQPGEPGTLVDETRGLVRAYQPDTTGVDPADLDAIQLLITGVAEVTHDATASAHSVDLNAESLR